MSSQTMAKELGIYITSGFNTITNTLPGICTTTCCGFVMGDYGCTVVSRSSINSDVSNTRIIGRKQRRILQIQRINLWP